MALNKMDICSAGPVTLRAGIETWPLAAPLRIAGHSWRSADVLMVTLAKGEHIGRGEAAGVYYRRESPSSMLAQIEALRSSIEAGMSQESVQRMLPPGGARHALDCALWDLSAKLVGDRAWRMAGLEQQPAPLLTTFTCGVGEPEAMAAVARTYEGARAIKIKLSGAQIDAERVIAVRNALPDVWLGVDANQAFSRGCLQRLMPTLVRERVSLIEQPFPTGQENLLDDFESPIPIAADESVQSLVDIPGLAGRFQVANIKLDKCGGLTEGLAMARAARELGLEPMVGNMVCTSLAIAPAFVLGQLCDVVDLDGPVFLKTDRPIAVSYSDGKVTCPESLWG